MQSKLGQVLLQGALQAALHPLSSRLRVRHGGRHCYHPPLLPRYRPLRGDAEDNVAVRPEVEVYHTRTRSSPEKCQELRGMSVELAGGCAGVVKRNDLSERGAEFVAGGGVFVVDLLRVDAPALGDVPNG